MNRKYIKKAAFGCPKTAFLIEVIQILIFLNKIHILGKCLFQKVQSY